MLSDNVYYESVYHLRYADTIIEPRRAIVTRRGLHCQVLPFVMNWGCIIAAERVVKGQYRRRMLPETVL